MKHAVLLHDSALPGLVEALDPAAMIPRLAPLVRHLEGCESTRAESWRVMEVEILKHKPGHRCALGYLLVGPEGRRRLFAKAYSSKRGRTITKTLEKIAEAIPREVLLIPRPLGYFPDLKLLVTEYLVGAPLARSLHEGESDTPAKRAVLAISALHDCDAPLVRRWTALRELANAAKWLDKSPPGSLASSGRARVLLEVLRRRAALLPETPAGPIHRDFYPDQIWECRNATALLDLDDARFGDRALDVGNFLAHLKLRSLQFPHLARGCERTGRVFRNEYERQRIGMESFPERVAFYEAVSLLRLSGVYSLRERWAQMLPSALLDSCEAVLDARG